MTKESDAIEVDATLSALRSECETCGAWSAFVGRTEVRDGRTYAFVRCPSEGIEFRVWKANCESLIAAYVRARSGVSDPAAYDRAFRTLLGGDAEAIASLVRRPPAELPLFAIEDVALPSDVALRWCELVLDWDGWRPRPARRVRLEEALAVAIHHNAPQCAERVLTRAARAELEPFVAHFARRFHGRDSSLLASIAHRP